MADLREIFRKCFEVVVANSKDLVDDSLRVRYQVYCVENQFEDAARFPDGMERDAYDDHSVHSIVRHRESGLTAATVRLVLPNPVDPASPFPIEEFCVEALAKGQLDPSLLPRNTLAEISRFAVSKEFKRRLHEPGTIAGVGLNGDIYPDPRDVDVQKKSKRLLPHITIGLFNAIVRMSAEHGITYWYAVMEPPLLRLLTRFGIHFTALGPLVDYHGFRQPCFGVAHEVLNGIYHHRRDVWELITENGEIWPPPMKTGIERTA